MQSHQKPAHVASHDLDFFLACRFLLLRAGFLQLQSVGAILSAELGLLTAKASPVTECRLEAWGLQEQRTGSTAQAAPCHLESSPTRDQTFVPCPCEGRFFSTVPPGKSQMRFQSAQSLF